ncbi:MAG: tetratricopeptide repeat protein [Sedimentisphaerales bacterium]|nr:tetratricopeptide repeat protein [Sedimentisphaerales bacterium]
MSDATVNNIGDLSKAIPFFKRAEEVATTDNFDYAIDMYIEGLKRAPDAVEQGHKPLRYNALVRQGKGGKKPSVLEKVKHATGKDVLKNMLNAEYLLAKDPDNLTYAEQMLRAAVAGKFKKTALWIADLLFEANADAEKPSLQTFLLLKDSYVTFEEYAKAVNACGYARKLKPEDSSLVDEFKNLSANLTLQKGKYDKEGDFRDSIKDREAQEKFQLQQAAQKSIDYRQQAVEDARNIVKLDGSIQNITRLANALSDLQDDESDTEAIKLLDKAYDELNDFTLKRRSGEIKLKMLRRRVRAERANSGNNPYDQKISDALEEATKQLLLAELEHYRLCMENNPLDLKFKYEYGLRLMRNQKYDEAIPYMQQAREDPRYRITAMNKVGLCFFMKGWFKDAIDLIRHAIEEYEIKDDALAKDLRYNLARAYEQQGDITAALEMYRKIAHLDFAYKDVRIKIDKLRKTTQ